MPFAAASAGLRQARASPRHTIRPFEAGIAPERILDERRFSSAVGSDQTVYGSIGYAEACIFQRDRPVGIDLFDPLDGKYRLI